MPRSSTSRIWTIVERFYRAARLFHRQYEEYERAVLGYVEETGIPRSELRLGPSELADLLNFKRLERIRDAFLTPLKSATHGLFRTADSTDVLDRVVNDLFHELSILKEEHYNVLTYDESPDSELDRFEQRAILDEVHEMFPIKVHRLQHLFELGRDRLEQVLPNHRDDKVLRRSLYLHRRGFVEDAYPDGLDGFYQILYGASDAHRGYREVGESFALSGFHRQAVEAFEEGLAALDRLESPDGTREWFQSRIDEARRAADDEEKTT